CPPAHPERVCVAQVPQACSSGGVTAGEASSSADFLSPAEAKQFCCKIWIFVAPTVMAIAIVSSSSSSVAPSCLATARQYRVQGSHPADNEAPKAMRCFVLRSSAPSVYAASKNSRYLLSESIASALCWGIDTAGFEALNKAPFVTGELLRPVSETISASTKPTCFIIARKSFPGIAPPIHPAQLSTRALTSSDRCPVSTWSAIIMRPPGFITRKTSFSAFTLSDTRLKTPLE